MSLINTNPLYPFFSYSFLCSLLAAACKNSNWHLLFFVGFHFFSFFLLHFLSVAIWAALYHPVILFSLDLPSALKDLMIFFRKNSNNSHNPAPLQIFLQWKRKCSALQSEFHWKPNVLVIKKKKIKKYIKYSSLFLMDWRHFKGEML